MPPAEPVAAGTPALDRGLRGRVWAALATVRDPELDEPLTDLGFVAALDVQGDAIRVELRLPTYFCAPNFAHLMVSDALAAVRGVAGGRRVQVRLRDHFAAAEINAGLAEARSFGETFPELADGELAELRASFHRKANAAAQERVAGALLAGGCRAEALAGLRLGDAPPGPELDRLRRCRAALGFSSDAGAPLLLDDTGRPLPAEAVAGHLRRARTVRISIEGNVGLCRNLLAARYPGPDPT